ncbi:hypothetical protein TSUD_256690 [Trifolium subterraneum]|uniref:Uncharacterized protein n=1 Tax=Trifolium subterraneum TaxID=3900 RepID=A0A2Z6M8X9_TRISU|nr:hypothetical protein TSUD_256690 [Trifolium subterraneum]
MNFECTNIEEELKKKILKCFSSTHVPRRPTLCRAHFLYPKEKGYMASYTGGQPRCAGCLVVHLWHYLDALGLISDG